MLHLYPGTMNDTSKGGAVCPPPLNTLNQRIHGNGLTVMFTSHDELLHFQVNTEI